MDSFKFPSGIVVNCDPPYPVPTGAVPRVSGPQAHVPQLGGLKNDSEKAARPELLPTEALEEISKVLAFGAKKYEDNNWRRGFKWTRVLGALFRHLYAWARGEDKDPETGLSHLAHAGCNVLFLLTFELTGAGQDDRFRKSA